MKLISFMKPTVKIELRLTMLLIMMLCVSAMIYLGCSGTGSSSDERQVLARVEVPAYLEDLNLPATMALVKEAAKSGGINAVK